MSHSSKFYAAFDFSSEMDMEPTTELGLPLTVVPVGSAVNFGADVATDAWSPGSNGWAVLIAKSRVDAGNHDAIVGQIEKLRAQGCVRIAIDMKGNRFTSLQAIHFFFGLSNELIALGGELALIAPLEKTKRHFEIYSSLKTIRIVRSREDLIAPSTAPSMSVPADL